MSYTVKETDTQKDKKLILEILTDNRQLDDFPFEKRFEWLYHQNPIGESRAWIIWNEKNAEPAGLTAVFPREVYINKRMYTGWNCGDFSIYNKYRTLGIALKLRKKAKEYIDNGEIPFLYAHPNNKMKHIHIKSGHKQIALMKRFAFPLNISGYKPQLPLKNLIDHAYHIFLKFKLENKGESEIQDQSNMIFDDGHLSVLESLISEHKVIGSRDKKYMEWKYKNHPIHKYHLFNYYENGHLFGYILYYVNKNTIHVFEMLSKPNPAGREKMVGLFVNTMASKHKTVKSISSIQQEYNPFSKVLVQTGFKYRDDSTSTAIAYSTLGEGLSDLVHDGTKWFMNVGDRDI